LPANACAALVPIDRVRSIGIAHLLVGFAHARHSLAHRMSLLNFLANQVGPYMQEGAAAFREQRAARHAERWL
jgi:hypothetical protein